jgi:SAM-dependent methyltransferase
VSADPKNRRDRTYDVFADFFDASYQHWRPSPIRLYAPILDGPLAAAESVCDLACGTGLLAFEMARRGARVVAVDRHPAMLARARARAARTPRMRVVRGDLRTFRSAAKFDLATCFFDSLNHLERCGDLARAFRTVASLLRPGGIFVFDLNTEAGVAHPWPDPPAVSTGRRDGRRFWRIASPLPFDRRRRRGGTRLEWLIEDRGGRFRHVLEDYWEIAWSEEEVRKSLEGAGFHRIDSWDGTCLEPSLRRGFRLYFRAVLRAAPRDGDARSPKTSKVSQSRRR